MSVAESAAKVRERLCAAPGIVAVPADGIEIFALPEFLANIECDGLIAMIDAGRKPSRVLADDPDPEFRTSESCDLDPAHPLVRRVEARLDRLIGLDPACGETIQGQRYAIGQQFKAHHDFFHAGEPYWETQQKAGGQRTWTAMIFLNAPEEGGETMFPRAKVKIRPRRGNLLAWNNLDPAGNPNMMSLHQGLPVLAGLKYVITKWYRERPWTPHLIRGETSGTGGDS
ncbi:MAG TPA: 2OG-Fe(II) oxygenase [Allosphingosinicella sp.]|nr:2OG-Fe(II) oxygenase [Allosphingosinicella sp.]